MAPLIRIAMAVIIALLLLRLFAPAFAERIKAVYMIGGVTLVLAIGLLLYALLD